MAIAFDAALAGMDIMRTAGVKLGLGTDLLGELYVQECREFTIRREVFTPLEILRQATSNNAEMMQLKGSSAASRRARWPTSWWSTATRSRTSGGSPKTGSTCARSCAEATS
jgi:hypothetical protein